VLLDFGSARQLAGGNRELTAVVSPGYAPLEQYHAHGKQGPWSDLYAFGGVMYWMVTGVKPVEAAARVRQDIMPPAAKAGEAQGYTPEFLAAVDWALKPSEDERPQSVADFRRALLGGQAGAARAGRTVPLAGADAPTVLAKPAEAGGTTGLTGWLVSGYAQARGRCEEIAARRRGEPIFGPDDIRPKGVAAELGADLGREITGFLDGTHVDLRMLTEVVIERCRPRFPRPDNKEVRKRRLWHTLHPGTKLSDLQRANSGTDV